MCGVWNSLAGLENDFIQCSDDDCMSSAGDDDDDDDDDADDKSV
jgi:hypothetical protein